MSDDSETAKRLAFTLELHDAGVQLMRENLRRRQPDASAEEIERALESWLTTRPGAEHGDGDGVPGKWPRR